MLGKLKEKLSLSDDFDYEAAVEENSADNVPEQLPAGVNSMLTTVSASSAHLLSEGGRFGSAYCKVMYMPKDGWPPEPKPGLLDRLASHGSSGIQIKIRIDPMSRERSVAKFKRPIRDKNKTLYAEQQSAAPDTSVVADEKQELEDVLRALKNGNERIYWVDVYFVIRGQTKRKVRKAQNEIARELAKDDVTVTTADWVTQGGHDHRLPDREIRVKRYHPDADDRLSTGLSVSVLNYEHDRGGRHPLRLSRPERESGHHRSLESAERLQPIGHRQHRRGQVL